GLIIEVPGNILGRGIELNERLNVIQHLVVQPINYEFHDFLQVFEVKQQSGPVQLRSAQRYTDFVVVPMRVLTLALVIPQIVARGKRIFYGDFVHPSPSPAASWGSRR